MLLARVRGGLRRRAGTAATSDLPGLDEAFASGEADLETVYRAHAPLVHAICRRTLDEHSAAEVTQDVFLSVWRARDQFDPRRGSLGAWIVGITRRRVIDHVLVGSPCRTRGCLMCMVTCASMLIPASSGCDWTSDSA
ncbi:MAG: RNA polymerase sigma factor [Ilumatobacteraceae bacterium]